MTADPPTIYRAWFCGHWIVLWSDEALARQYLANDSVVEYARDWPDAPMRHWMRWRPAA